jgi:hypothetical protein
MTLTPTESFVPLTTALPVYSSKRTEFQATVISQSDQTQKFRSVAMPAAATSLTRGTPHAGNCEPQVSLQREGNRVTGIRVQCSCGEVIELACAYEPAATVPQPVIAPQPLTEPQPATMPQPEAAAPKPGKICKDSGKVLPTPASKRPKVPEKGRGTSAAKRRSA